MNFYALLLQTAVPSVAALLGAFAGARLSRQTEKLKHLQELRSAAYADFLRGFALAARAQNDTMSNERREETQLQGSALVTDSRARIAIYGGVDVVRAISQFAAVGMQTHSPEGIHAFANLCRVMRIEVGQKNPSAEDVRRAIFS